MAASGPSLLLPLALLALIIGTNAVGPQNGRASTTSGEEIFLDIEGSHSSIQEAAGAGAAAARLRLRLLEEPCAPNGSPRRVLRAVVLGEQSGDPLPAPQRLQQEANPQLNALDSATPPRGTTSRASAAADAQWPFTLPERTNFFSDYVKVAGIGRYKVHHERVGWVRAQQICGREGATLAVPNSEREADALWQLKRSAPPPPPPAGQQEEQRRPRTFMDMAVAGLHHFVFHVGVRRFDPRSNFTTIFGDELNDTGFSTWAAEPSQEEHCGAMFQNTGLKAVLCDSTFPFICELPL